MQTGDVLALASAPDFGPAEFMGRISTEHWTNVLNHPIQKPLLNRATQENYHPGSILKMLTALAALEMEALDPNALYNVEADPTRPGRGCMTTARSAKAAASSTSWVTRSSVGWLASP